MNDSTTVVQCLQRRELGSGRRREPVRVVLDDQEVLAAREVKKSGATGERHTGATGIGKVRRHVQRSNGAAPCPRGATRLLKGVAVDSEVRLTQIGRAHV